MEKISGYSKISEMTDLSSDHPFFLFPVRHHSPVCSWHLKKAAEKYRPDIILTEGPCSANELIEVLTSENTVLPAAFYYYYKDTGGLVSEEKLDYKCYYPFVYSSPEYNALKLAKEMGIPAEFIDLPYSEILINTADDRGLRKNAERNSYADDSLLVKSRFFRKICEKTGVRDFDEFWEKYFEINGLYISTEQFLKQMHTYCVLTRQEVSEDEMKADGTAARELFMAQKVKEAMEKYSRVMVVTGGFHSRGIYELLNKKTKNIRLHSIPQKNQGCYPLAYSYEACSSLRGYSSGMNCPGFYDSVMKKLSASEKYEGIYSSLCDELLIKTAKESVKRDYPVSVPEITGACSMAAGLSALRNCRESGYYEVMDAVTSCYIKGEKTLSSSVPLDILRQIAEGKSTGHIGDSRHVPPLIADFEKISSELGLKHLTAVYDTVECPLFSTQKGIRTSRFLHMMDFLGTGFASLVKGPDLHGNRDRSRVREEWKYRRTPGVDAALTDHTTDGTTIEEACRNYAMKLIRKSSSCAETSEIMVDCFLMGINITDREHAVNIIYGDGDVFSLADGMRHFKTLYELRKLYMSTDETPLACLEACYRRLAASVPVLAGASADRADDAADILKLMGEVVSDIMTDKKSEFFSCLKEICRSENREPSVYGTATGLLCAEFPEYRSTAASVMRGYLSGSSEVKKQGAEFLKGLFSAARDIVFSDAGFLEMTDTLICEMDYDDFISVLPSLRLAFSSFTPSEIKMCSSVIADFHSTDAGSILNASAVDEKLAEFSRKFDSTVFSLLRGEVSENE